MPPNLDLSISWLDCMKSGISIDAQDYTLAMCTYVAY